MVTSKVRAGLILAAMVAVFCPSAVFAQSGSRPSNEGWIPFLETTDVFLSTLDGLRFEAQLFPHLVIFENLDELGTSSSRSRFFSVTGTPAVRLRMFNAKSKPVRTPSYMPRVNVQMLFAPRLAREVKEEVLRSGTSNRNHTNTELLIGLHLTYSHHSNGQDGCLYLNEVRDADGECQPTAPGAAESLQVNKRDGSFSTNFIRLGSNVRWSRVGDGPRSEMDRELRAHIEWHPKALVGSRIVDQYGRLRLLAGGSYSRPDIPWCKRSASVSASAEYITLGRPADVDPVAGSATIACYPSVDGGWGIFARAYSGQDYYNLGFRENIRTIQLGFSYSTDGFMVFKR